MRVKSLQRVTLTKPRFTGGNPCVESAEAWFVQILKQFSLTGQGWSLLGKIPMTQHGYWLLNFKTWFGIYFSLHIIVCKTSFIVNQVDGWPRLCWLWRCRGEEYWRGVYIYNIPMIWHSVLFLHLYPLHFVPSCSQLKNTMLSFVVYKSEQLCW